MPSPLLYEVHTRRWLHALSRHEGRSVSLANVPDSTFTRWTDLGVTHLWLMGVWTTGPKSREAYLQLPDTTNRLHSLIPNWKPEDVAASPYAISSYRVAEEFGGEVGLAEFRRRLHQHGIQLILDFVPNHVGLDHPWLSRSPQRFIQSSDPHEGFFQNAAAENSQWIAHGKDPYFPAWIDTAQLDLRLAETHDALIDELRSIAARCDGVRCDMAMLALRDVFEANWGSHSPTGSTTQAEFWTSAIAAAGRPGFLFIAEAYWDLEARLLDLGFDYSYDKRVTDQLIHRHWSDLESHLASIGETRTQRSVHFLENHDEPRFAATLPLEDHALAAFLVTALPGMCLVFDGQLEGARVQSPVQLTSNPVEAANPEVEALYEQLFTLWKSAGMANDFRKLLCASPIVAILCSTSPTRHLLALINGRHERQRVDLDVSRFQLRLPVDVRSLRKSPAPSFIEAATSGDTLTVQMPPQSYDLVELTSRG